MTRHDFWFRLTGSSYFFLLHHDCQTPSAMFPCVGSQRFSGDFEDSSPPASFPGLAALPLGINTALAQAL